MVLADPGFVVPEGVEVLDEAEVSLQGEGGVLAEQGGTGGGDSDRMGSGTAQCSAPLAGRHRQSQPSTDRDGSATNEAQAIVPHDLSPHVVVERGDLVGEHEGFGKPSGCGKSEPRTIESGPTASMIFSVSSSGNGVTTT